MAGQTGGTAAKILVFDSGLGGLTIYRELVRRMPEAEYLYVADNAVFPYGNLADDELVTRLLALFDILIEREQPDICVIACNTASTIALAPLRDHFAVPFVGVVPAIKMAAEQTKTGLFSVLATPGTVKRDYTRDLIARYAADCEVTLVGATDLADLAEQFMRGEKVDPGKLLHEIAPAFVEKGARRTDIVALGCTHYPLLTDLMRNIAPWPVNWIDTAPAIARQTQKVLSGLAQGGHGASGGAANRLIHTGQNATIAKVEAFLRKVGITAIYRDEIIG